jgi:hypothetical protein
MAKDGKRVARALRVGGFSFGRVNTGLYFCTYFPVSYKL